MQFHNKNIKIKLKIKFKNELLVTKSEPNVWSMINRKMQVKGAPWDGVKIIKLLKFKNMKIGDQCFFYHSNIGKEIVGIVEN